MIRVIIFLLVVVAAASGLAWLADRPGTLVINWEGREIQTTVFHAIVLLAMLLIAAIVAWSIFRGVWQMPASIGNLFNRRREKRGLEALSSGMIAIGSGDRSLATRYAVQARKSLPNEPLTHILRAQAAQLSGDRATARRIFEAMLASPDTEPLGLRGLFLEAEQEGETEAARQFAERAIKLNPKVAWPIHALFDLQCKAHDWDGALDTLSTARKNGHIEKGPAERKRAVLLTAQAQVQEDTDPENAMKLAEEAHGLAPDLVPASAISGRLLAARGNVQKATKILQKAWRKGPHPDLATAYAFARTGDSPKDRLTRVQQLAALSPHAIESPVAVANAAIDARDFDTARGALEPLMDGRLTQRVCTLMARIEGEDGGNTGAVREWLARAVNAPRDPAWVADGVTSDDWGPVSPVTGALDAFEWKVPVEASKPRDAAILQDKIEELVALGSPRDSAGSAAAAVAAVSTATSSARPTSTEAADVLDLSSKGSGASASTNGVAPSGGAGVTSSATSNSDRAPVRKAEAEDVEVIAEAPNAALTTPAAQTVNGAIAPTAMPMVTEPDEDGGIGPAYGGANVVSGVGGSDPAGSSDASVAVGAPVPQAGSDQNRRKYEEARARAAEARAEASRNTNVAAEAAKAAAAKSTGKPNAPSSKAAAPEVFISPRAPDDPGPRKTE